MTFFRARNLLRTGHDNIMRVLFFFLSYFVVVLVLLLDSFDAAEVYCKMYKFVLVTHDSIRPLMKLLVFLLRHRPESKYYILLVL